MMISCSPEATASSTTYWMVGLSTRGSISLGCAFVAGRNRVPRPAAGKTALRTFAAGIASYLAHSDGVCATPESADEYVARARDPDSVRHGARGKLVVS